MQKCSSCGSTESIEQIKAKHPDALSCCPERNMVEVKPKLGLREFFEEAFKESIRQCLEDFVTDEFETALAQVISHNVGFYSAYLDLSTDRPCLVLDHTELGACLVVEVDLSTLGAPPGYFVNDDLQRDLAHTRALIGALEDRKRRLLIMSDVKAGLVPDRPQISEGRS